jgi:hypothetical protein
LLTTVTQEWHFQEDEQIVWWKDRYTFLLQDDTFEKCFSPPEKNCCERKVHLLHGHYLASNDCCFQVQHFQCVFRNTQKFGDEARCLVCNALLRDRHTAFSTYGMKHLQTTDKLTSADYESSDTEPSLSGDNNDAFVKELMMATEKAEAKTGMASNLEGANVVVVVVAAAAAAEVVATEVTTVTAVGDKLVDENKEKLANVEGANLVVAAAVTAVTAVGDKLVDESKGKS